MADNNAFFISLSTQEKNAIRRFFDSPPHTNLTDAIRVTRFEKTTVTPTMVLFYHQRLLQTNPALFRYLSETQRNVFEDNLMLAVYQLCERYQRADHEGHHQTLPEQFTEIERGLFLLENIRLARENKPLKALPKPSASCLSHFLFSAELNFFANKAEYILSRMRAFNYWRLYWVWCNMMMSTAISMMDLTYRHMAHTYYVITAYQNICGWISWTLYAARLLLNLMQVMKHSLPCAYWMSAEEIRLVQEQGIWNRFKEQLDERKFEIMNDIIWGLVNYLCHWWLFGSATLDMIANWLTVGLLVGDNLLGAWSRAETIDLHHVEETLFADQIDLLNQQINLATDEEQQAYLTAHKKYVEHIRHEFLLHWQYINRGLNADRFFTALQCLAFIQSCLFLAPEATQLTTSSMALALSGPLCLFFLSWLSSIYKGYMDICNAQDQRLRALLACKDILDRQHFSQKHELLYQELQAEATHQAQLSQYYWARMMRSTVIEGMIPLVIYFAFTYFAFQTAAFIMACLVIAAIGSHLYIDFFKPEKIEVATSLTRIDHAKITEQSSELARAIHQGQPYRPLKWLFHSEEELGTTTNAHRLIILGQ